MGKHNAPVEHLITGRRVVAGTTLAAASIGSVGTLVDAASASPLPSLSEWNAIEKCESGGANVKNPSSTASGYFQILTSTWLAHGGGEFASTARGATYAQQLIVANRVWVAAGGSFTPWNPSRSCWAPLMANGGITIPVVTASPPVSVVVDSPPVKMAYTYTVVEGDCLSVIAHRFGVSTADLYLANRSVIGDNEDLIFPGQVLTLTGSVSSGAHVNTGPQHAAPVTDPVPHATLTQGFKGAAHEGVDLAAPLRSPIFSATAGVVEFVGPASGFGDWIVITSVIDGQKVDFVYGHEYPSGISVTKGQRVAVGQLIGHVGANGNATGPHVHFEVWVGGRIGGHAIDPVAWMGKYGVVL